MIAGNSHVSSKAHEDYFFICLDCKSLKLADPYRLDLLEPSYPRLD
jgi:hypothetical protein